MTRKIPVLMTAVCLALLSPLALRAQGATATTTTAAVQQDDDARAVVDELHGALLKAMKESDALGYEGRYQLLAPVLQKTFDLEFMARFAVGGHWKDLSEDERRQWLDTFGLMTTANYAGRFNEFTGQHFETVGEQPGTRDTVFIRTKLVLPAADDVELTYRLREADGTWRIIDVYFNGTVSELSLRRSDYSSVLKRDGFENLVASLNQKAADLAAGKTVE